MSTRLQKKLPIGRPLDMGNPSYGNEINRRRRDSTCVWTSLSFFHCTCVHTSLFYPLRMCFRSRVFKRLFFSTAHLYRRPIYSAEHAFSVSLFFSVAYPFRRLLFFRGACAQTYLFSFPLCILSVVSLLWKAEEKGRGCSLRRWCVTASLKALPKISHCRPKYGIFPIFQQRQLIKKKNILDFSPW